MSNSFAEPPICLTKAGTKFGKELGDVIEGDFSGKLAGWKNCECNGEGKNNGGKNDKWDVVCQKLLCRVNFKVIVGSKFYFTSLSPSVGSPVNLQGAELK